MFDVKKRKIIFVVDCTIENQQVNIYYRD